jgi:hypothetical protein
MSTGKKDWRELCIAVLNETDTTKLLELTEELIAAFDEQNPSPSLDTVLKKPTIDALAESELLRSELLPLAAVQSHPPCFFSSRFRGTAVRTTTIID